MALVAYKECREIAVMLAILCVPLNAGAETLKSDAIVCETEQPLALLAEPNLANQPGSVVLKRVVATVEFYRQQRNFHGALSNLANTERDIWKDTRTPNRGATASRADEARIGEQKALNDAERYSEFLKRCAATGAQEQPAAIIEARPISRAVKLRTLLRDRDVELWTHEFYVKTE